ncbi:hypothetical protein [Kitasatospora sp. NBC_00039]|uniref:hypothetical protein n=1 Tax=Kitasatospora sp. NBC_00039 TaxID=2903565 RepID=UPI003245C68F
MLTAAAVAVAAGAAVAVPAGTATAAPLKPGPASRPDPSGKPSLTQRAWEGIRFAVGEKLDQSDPNYRAKLGLQQVMKAGLERMKTDNTTPVPSDVLTALRAYTDYQVEWKSSLPGSEKELAASRKKPAKAQAKLQSPELTGKKREKAEKAVEKAETRNREVEARYDKALKANTPEPQEMVQNLETKKAQLEKDLQGATKGTANYKKIDKSLTATTQQLADAKRVFGGPHGPDGKTGTTTEPKTPVTTKPTTSTGKSPTTTTAKTPTSTGRTPTSTGVKPPTTTRAPLGVGRQPAVTTVAPPVTGKFPVGARMPRLGGGGIGLAPVLAGLAEQATNEHYDREHQELLEKAYKDPALRKRILDDYHQMKGADPIDHIKRGFDTSKGFTQGASLAIGPKLEAYQKALDAKAKAQAKADAADREWERKVKQEAARRKAQDAGKHDDARAKEGKNDKAEDTSGKHAGTEAKGGKDKAPAGTDKHGEAVGKTEKGKAGTGSDKRAEPGGKDRKSPDGGKDKAETPRKAGKTKDDIGTDTGTNGRETSGGGKNVHVMPAEDHAKPAGNHHKDAANDHPRGGRKDEPGSKDKTAAKKTTPTKGAQRAV